MFSKIELNHLGKAKALIQNAEIFQFNTALVDGWDTGDFYVGNRSDINSMSYHVRFSNESLLLSQAYPSGADIIIATAPDIITLYDSNTYMPLTNEDLQEHAEKGTLSQLRVTLGVIEASEHWWVFPEKTEAAWQPYFKRLGYIGKIIRYPF